MNFLQMTPLCLTWHLLWDRRYGPRIQDRLKSGGVLDFDFCSDIATEAKAELIQLGASYEDSSIG